MGGLAGLGGIFEAKNNPASGNSSVDTELPSDYGTDVLDTRGTSVMALFALEQKQGFGVSSFFLSQSYALCLGRSSPLGLTLETAF